MSGWLDDVRNRIQRDFERGRFLENVADEDFGDDHVSRHIGKSPSYLIDRGFAERGYGKFAMSSFDEACAGKILVRCLYSMITEAPDFFRALAALNPGERLAADTALAADPRVWVDESGGGLILDPLQKAIVLEPSGSLVEVETNVVRIVFRSDGRAPYGFSVVTAYPSPIAAPKIPLIGVRKEDVFARRTGRDLRSDLEKTRVYRNAGPLEKAYLRRAADPAGFRGIVLKASFDPARERREPRLYLAFSSSNGREFFSAQVRPSGEVSIRPVKPCRSRAGGVVFSPAGEPGWGLQSREGWDRLYLANGRAANCIAGVVEELCKAAGGSRPMPRYEKSRNRAPVMSRASVAASCQSGRTK